MEKLEGGSMREEEEHQEEEQAEQEQEVMSRDVPLPFALNS